MKHSLFSLAVFSILFWGANVMAQSVPGSGGLGPRNDTFAPPSTSTVGPRQSLATVNKGCDETEAAEAARTLERQRGDRFNRMKDDEKAFVQNQCDESEVRTKLNDIYNKPTITITGPCFDLRVQDVLSNCEGLNSLMFRSQTFSITDKLTVGDESSLRLIDTPNAQEPDQNILYRVIRLLAQTLGTFAVLMFIIAGVLMITSEGDQNRLQRGKNIFFYTIIGLLVAFCSYILVQLVLYAIFTAA